MDFNSPDFTGERDSCLEAWTRWAEVPRRVCFGLPECGVVCCLEFHGEEKV